MPSSKSPIRSRMRCPKCGSPLFYISAGFFFFIRKKKRKCLAPDCDYEDPGRFKIVVR